MNRAAHESLLVKATMYLVMAYILAGGLAANAVLITDLFASKLFIITPQH